MKRRNFLKKAGLAASLPVAAAVATACGGKNESATISSRSASKREWKMVTTWPKNFPGLGTGANKLAQMITDMSDGQLTVKVYGGGELVGPLEIFDAVSSGTAEMGHGAAYYWKGKTPAAQFFASVPFGFNAQEMNGWVYYGGGQELWDELYAEFNLKPFLAGNTGVQMGGWFNKLINSVRDLRGLRMRIPGLGGEALKLAGGTPVLLPGGEIFNALERGTIDATEWVGPYNDLAFGLYKAARYYYYPGWHEPGTGLEAFVNKKAYDELPSDLQKIIEVACQAANLDMLSDFTANNLNALTQLKDEHNVRVLRFPDSVLRTMNDYTQQALANLVDTDPDIRRVHESFATFRKKAFAWHDISERSYYNTRNL